MSAPLDARGLGPSRRDFLTAATTVAAAAAATSAMACMPPHVTSGPLTATPGGVLLFQGDSITDDGRARSAQAANDDRAMGFGYPLLIAGALLSATTPAGWRCYNRGISGNMVPDLQARWATDTVALQPNILSLLIGVNDYWHRQKEDPSKVIADYEASYTALMAETRRALPATRVVILEPFVLRYGTVDASWFPAFNEIRAVAARVATQAGALFVPLQETFDRRAAQTRPEDWVRDGVHPTLAGHALIAAQWRAATGL